MQGLEVLVLGREACVSGLPARCRGKTLTALGRDVDEQEGLVLVLLQGDGVLGKLDLGSARSLAQIKVLTERS